MKDSHYFPHYYNSRNDDKILQLRLKFGAEGYGLYWMLLESMAENSEGGLSGGLIGGLSLGFNTPVKKLTELVNFCIKIGLFVKVKDGFSAKRIIEHKGEMKLYVEYGKLGAEKKRKMRVAQGGLQGGSREATSNEMKRNEMKRNSNTNESAVKSSLKENIYGANFEKLTYVQKGIMFKRINGYVEKFREQPSITQIDHWIKTEIKQ